METQESNKFLVPLAIVVAGMMIAGSIYFGDKGGATPIVSNTPTKDVEVGKVGSEDHIRGASTAQFFVVEYSDTECPFCKVFHETMKDILTDYSTEVAWVYRHFPIAQLHSKAPKEAEATECAADQGGTQMFWNYIDEVFERTSSNDSLPETELAVIAKDLGLDVTAFNTCLSSGKYTEFIQKSIEGAVKAGARGTPYSIVLDKDGEVKLIINGAEPIESVKAKLDALLK